MKRLEDSDCLVLTNAPKQVYCSMACRQKNPGFSKLIVATRPQFSGGDGDADAAAAPHPHMRRTHTQTLACTDRSLHRRGSPFRSEMRFTAP